QLSEKGVPANRLQRALAALREKLSQVQAPLAELRVLSDGRDVIVERGGSRLKPISGQFVLNFETRELDERVRVMSGRSAADWLALEISVRRRPRCERMCKRTTPSSRLVCCIGMPDSVWLHRLVSLPVASKN